MSEITRTKTITLGEPYIRELISSINSQIELIKNDPNWQYNNSKIVLNLDSFISLLKQIPWNEGGYSIEDFT